MPAPALLEQAFCFSGPVVRMPGAVDVIFISHHGWAKAPGRRCAKPRDGVSYLALYRSVTPEPAKETGFCVIPSRTASSTDGGAMEWHSTSLKLRSGAEPAVRLPLRAQAPPVVSVSTAGTQVIKERS